MAKVLSGFLLVFILASCYHSAKEPDFNMSMVLPADSMVTLITDIHLADGIVNMLKDKKKTVKPLATEYFEAVLKKHAISRDIFEESMRYYAFHTEELNEIYERVIIDLSKKESMVIPRKDQATPADSLVAIPEE